MASALSMDLRERIVAACDQGEGTRKEIAARFSVSQETVRKLFKQWRETGDLRPLFYRCSGKRKILEGHRRKLHELLEDRPDRTLEELREGLGLDCTLQAIHYVLKDMGYTFKKRRYEPANRIAKM